MTTEAATLATATRLRRVSAASVGRRRPPAVTALIYLCALLFAGWILIPVWFLVVSSLTPASEATTHAFSYLPRSVTLDNFGGLLSGSAESASYGSSGGSGSRLLPAIGNSLLVAVVVVIVNLFVAGIAAYAMSRFPFRGSKTFHTSIIATRVVPAIAIIGPIFMAFRVLQMLDTPWALIISYNVFTLPLAILVLKNYFDQLPIEIEEAATIDGASRWRTLWLVVVPLARPGLVATGVLVFLEAWSEFFYALVLTDQLTVPPLLVGFQSVQEFSWNSLAAATVLALIPPVVLVLIFQRHVVGALAAGYEK